MLVGLQSRLPTNLSLLLSGLAWGLLVPIELLRHQGRHQRIDTHSYINASPLFWTADLALILVSRLSNGRLIKTLLIIRKTLPIFRQNLITLTPILVLNALHILNSFL